MLKVIVNSVQFPLALQHFGSALHMLIRINVIGSLLLRQNSVKRVDAILRYYITTIFVFLSSKRFFPLLIFVLFDFLSISWMPEIYEGKKEETTKSFAQTAAFRARVCSYATQSTCLCSLSENIRS